MVTKLPKWSGRSYWKRECESANDKKRNDLNAVFFFDVSEFESGRAVKSGLDPTLMGLVCKKTGVRRR